MAWRSSSVLACPRVCRWTGRLSPLSLQVMRSSIRSYWPKRETRLVVKMLKVISRASFQRSSTIHFGTLSAELPILGPGDFFGEGGMAGQSVRMGTATAITPTSLLVIEKTEMIRVLHAEHAFSDRFVSYMLSRNIRIEEDLIDQLFNSSEKRLARTLLLLARYGKEPQPQKMLPKVSQEMLAEMIGTTRSRVNFFMNKFRKLGFIHYNGGLQVHSSLISVVLHE